MIALRIASRHTANRYRDTIGTLTYLHRTVCDCLRIERSSCVAPSACRRIVACATDCGHARQPDHTRLRRNSRHTEHPGAGFDTRSTTAAAHSYQRRRLRLARRSCDARRHRHSGPLADTPREGRPRQCGEILGKGLHDNGGSQLGIYVWRRQTRLWRHEARGRKGVDEHGQQQCVCRRSARLHRRTHRHPGIHRQERRV